MLLVNLEPFSAAILGLLINKMYKHLAHHIFYIHSHHFLMKIVMHAELRVEMLPKGIIVPFHKASISTILTISCG